MIGEPEDQLALQHAHKPPEDLLPVRQARADLRLILDAEGWAEPAREMVGELLDDVL
jgi:hypothetical protein